MNDLSRGYSFTDGVVDDCSSAHLHQLIESATIQTTFHTGKTSAGASPGKAVHEVMVYRNTDLTWYRGTLGGVIFDSAEMLASRTAKTVPVAADLLLLADSAAALALKQITAKNLMFGADPFPAENLDGENDLFPVYNASDGQIYRFPLSKIILRAAAAASADGADYLLVCSAAGSMRSIAMKGLITQAPALAAPAAGDSLPIYDLSTTTYKSVVLSDLINGLADTETAPDGTELMQIYDGADGGKLKKLGLRALGTYVRAFPPEYYRFQIQRLAGADGGATVAGSWQERTFNNVVNTQTDPAVRLSTQPGYVNHFMLFAGSYQFRCTAVGFYTGALQARLILEDTGEVLALGPLVRGGSGVQMLAECSGRLTVVADTYVHLLLQTRVAVSNAAGAGSAAGWGTEVYGEAEFWRT